MAPGALVIYGDIGEAVFRMNASTEDEVFEWTKRAAHGLDVIIDVVGGNTPAITHGGPPMKNIPNLSTARVGQLPFDADMSCDHCHAPVEKWPTGLATIDREFGTFTLDFITCPNCIHDVHFAQPRDGVEFAYIKWFWFVGN